MKSRISILCLLISLLYSCHKKKVLENPEIESLNYRTEMRNFVIGIAGFANQYDSDFIIIPQNGQGLVFENDDPGSALQSAYLQAIDGQGREDLFFGYDEDDVETPVTERDIWMPALHALQNENKVVLVTDYCSTPANMDASYAANEIEGFVSFAADNRELNQIPLYPTSLQGENNMDIQQLHDVQNFLYLINTENYNSKQEFIDAVVATNYDMIIMDAFFDNTLFTYEEVEQLRQKANGGKRLVIAYMSIGEAEDYRYYWQNTWNIHPPEWLGSVNPDWPGNFKIEYWNQEWQQIIFGNSDSYVRKILNSGFDGTYLDLIDAYEYMEETR